MTERDATGKVPIKGSGGVRLRFLEVKNVARECNVNVEILNDSAVLEKVRNAPQKIKICPKTIRLGSERLTRQITYKLKIVLASKIIYDSLQMQYMLQEVEST